MKLTHFCLHRHLEEVKQTEKWNQLGSGKPLASALMDLLIPIKNLSPPKRLRICYMNMHINYINSIDS